MQKIEMKDKVEKVEPVKQKASFDFKNFFVQNRVMILLVSASTLVSIGSLFYLYIYVFKVPPTPSQIIKLSGNYVEHALESSQLQVLNIATPSIPKTEESPLNGVLYTKDEMKKMLDRRPVATMINNHFQGRPQSGLNSADIVYEALAESGITRYMTIHWSNGANKVGPIRSARQYYLEWLSPFDALYIHDGCAATSDARTNACGNIFSYSIKDVSTRGAWRSTDRFAPHNEYSSILTAWEYGKENNWDAFPPKTESLQYKRDAGFDQRGAKTRVKVRFRTDMANGGTYDTEWIYDRNTNLYTHRIGGTTDIDNETKKAITAKNVIIEEVSMLDAFDGKGRVIIDTIGQGNAKILMDGKIINAKWKKTSRTDRTRYYDSAGKEIELNRGKIWICVIPKDKGKFDIIDQ